MYRTGDPRFRRRLDEIGQSVEHATESAQIRLVEAGRTYLKPCFESVSSCFTTCVEASCPTLNLTASQRDRIRRQKGRGGRGRAELNFDFYDDWDEDENDALMGWGNDEFDRLLAGSGGYGTISHTQPARQRGMSYPKGRRKSAVQAHDGGIDPTIIPGSSLFGKLFGGKALKYKPSAAGLQDHPGAKLSDVTEGEALLREGGEGGRRKHRRMRSATVSSGHTTDSLSSRGDIFPSDEEDDAIPLDDEFAMVLERRATNLSGPETESSSGKTRSTGERRRDKRPSAGSRRSTHSSRSRGGRRRSRSWTNSSAEQTPIDEAPPDVEQIPNLSEMKQEERELEREEEQQVERKRQEAQRLAAERGLADRAEVEEDGASKEATPEIRSPTLQPVQRSDEPSQLPTPLATDDEEETEASSQPSKDGGDSKT